MNAKVVPFEMQNFQMTSHISQPTVVFDFTDTPGSVSVESAYAVDPIQRFRISDRYEKVKTTFSLLRLFNLFYE